MRISTWLLVMLGGLLSATPGYYAYRFLFMMPFGSPSHKYSLDPIALELVKRGHQVTIMSAVNAKTNVENYTNIVLEDTQKHWDNSDFNFFKDGTSYAQFIKNLYDRIFIIANATYQQPEIVDILKNPRDSNNQPQFDLLVVDAIFDEFCLPLAQKMEIPSVFMSPSFITPPIYWDMNIPNPPYLHYFGVDHLSISPFVGRLTSAVINIVFRLYQSYYVFPRLEEIIHKVYPEALPLQVLQKNVSFLMANSHFSFGPQVPTMPYYVEIGGLSITDANKLPKEFEDIMESSGENGVIFFSLGSFTRGDALPLEARNNFLKAFEKLPQTILWKYEQNIDNLPSNIKLTKWAPQKDLLGHPKLRLFITHGGGLSTQEATYNGVPLLGVPISADQPSNIAHAKSKGFAESIDWRTFTVDELLGKIHGIIHNPRYKEQALKASIIMKDRPEHPAKTAAYWLEYVIRHQGAAHLKSGAEHLNYFQYMLLDVLAVVAMALLIIGFTMYFISKKCIHFLKKVIRRPSGISKEVKSVKFKNNRKKIN